jgi:hypothetical protein
MSLATIRRSLLAALLLCGPAALAQGPGMMPPMGVSPAQMQAQQLQMELMQIDQQLAATQKKVLDSDPALMKKQATVGEKIQAALEASPETGPQLKRLDEIRAAIDASGAAPGAVPTAEVQQLILEGQQVSLSLKRAQEGVMSTEPLKSEIDALEKEMTDAMKAADPQAVDLFERRDAVVAQLVALVEGRAPTPQ